MEQLWPGGRSRPRQAPTRAAAAERDDPGSHNFRAWRLVKRTRAGRMADSRRGPRVARLRRFAPSRSATPPGAREHPLSDAEVAGGEEPLTARSWHIATDANAVLLHP